MRSYRALDRIGMHQLPTYRTPVHAWCMRPILHRERTSSSDIQETAMPTLWLQLPGTSRYLISSPTLTSILQQQKGPYNSVLADQSEPEAVRLAPVGAHLTASRQCDPGQGYGQIEAQSFGCANHHAS